MSKIHFTENVYKYFGVNVDAKVALISSMGCLETLDDDDDDDDDHQKTTEANIIGRHPWLRTLPRATAWLIMIIMMIIDK